MPRKKIPTTKSDIISAVIPLFAKGGYAGVSMRDIAKAVSLSPASLYNHFPDKESIYREMLNEIYKGQGKLFARLGDVDSPVRERLEGFMREICMNLSLSPEFCKLFLRVIADDDKEREAWLVEKVSPNFDVLNRLMLELVPGRDHFNLLDTLMGSLIYHFAATDFSKMLPGYGDDNGDPQAYADFLSTMVDLGLVGSAPEKD